MLPEVRIVFADVAARPLTRHPEAVEPGWFIVKDDVVILTDEHDKPYLDATGRYEMKLAKGDNPKDIAAILFRQWRGENRSGEDFRRPLSYPPTGGW